MTAFIVARITCLPCAEIHLGLYELLRILYCHGTCDECIWTKALNFQVIYCCRCNCAGLFQLYQVI